MKPIDHTKLIIVEGIMGSGKSSISGLLVNQLRRSGRSAHRYGNPAEGLRQPPDEFRAVLRNLPDRRRVWGELESPVLMERNMSAWERFVAGAVAKQDICVFDGRFFNGDFAGLMMMGVPEVQLADHLSRIVSIARPLHPHLVYLHPSSVEHGLRRIAVIRGARWVDSQVGWKTASPYCRARGLTGFDGWIELYREYRDVSRRLLRELNLPTIEIDISDEDWNAYHRMILAFLGMPPLHTLGYRLGLLRNLPRSWLSRGRAALRAYAWYGSPLVKGRSVD